MAERRVADGTHEDPAMNTAIHARNLAEELTASVESDRVVAALFSTYTFGRQFFEEGPLQAIADEGARRGVIPVTVVLDRARYAGSGIGYEVVRAPGDRLWHAKAIVLMTRRPGGQETRTILVVGSGNLTRPGWERNQELFSVETWDGWSLPAALRTWLRQRWLCGSLFARWCADQKVGQRNSKEGVRLISSLDEPIWCQLRLPRTGSQWSEAHVLAPFADGSVAREAEPGGGGGAFFTALLQQKRDAAAVIHVYLRGLAGSPDAVVGSRSVLDGIRRTAKVRFHVLEEAPDRAFHAKLFAWKTRGAWSVVTGSPNATGAAMVRGGENIELAWEFVGIGQHLPAGLLPPSTLRRFEDLRFVPPAFEAPRTWNAVERAVYDPNKDRVRLTWLDGHGPRDTMILLDGARVNPEEISLAGALDRALQVRPRRRSDSSCQPSWVPIEMPAELFDDLAQGNTDPLSADEWLARLGSPCWSQSEDGRLGAPRSGKRHPRRPDVGDGGFAWSEKVRNLEEGLKALHQEIEDAESDTAVDRLVRTLHGVWDSHDPTAIPLHGPEVAWRKWVRAGVWRALALCDGRLKRHRPLCRLRRIWAKQVSPKLKEFPIGT